MPTKEHAYRVFQALKEHYPDAKMILRWGNNFELLVAIMLSAQCTDKKVNEVTSRVFPKYRQTWPRFHNHYANYLRISTPKGEKSSELELQKGTLGQHPQHATLSEEEWVELINFSYVPREELEQDIKPTGFYHNKAKSVQSAAQVVLEKYQGLLPRSLAELTTIPGVGRKTANVFLGNAYGIYEGIAVDTHVTKQSQALGLSKEKTPEKIEQDLMRLFDKKDWFALTYLLIEHGRNLRKKKSDQLRCSSPECLLCKQK